MKCALVLGVLTVLLSVFLHGAVSLPPDFFRAGRRGFPLPPHKKSVQGETDLASAACSFCGTYNVAWELQCRRHDGEHRRACMVALLSELKNVVSNKGWETESQEKQ